MPRKQPSKLELKRGTKVEMEHTKIKAFAKKIAMDHLQEDPHYYTKLLKMEGKKRRRAKFVTKKGSISFLHYKL